MILLLDNFDSFTYNLADYVAQSGVECHILRNNIPLSQIKKKSYEGIILSPGPQTPKQAGNMMEVLHYYAKHLPILGICLGHQAIGEYFGARLVKAARPMHGKISAIQCARDELFKDLPVRINVVRYHSLLLEHLPLSLAAIASTDEQEIMAIRHQTLPIKGIQFHPEAALTEHGLRIVRNWVNLVVFPVEVS